MLGKLGGNPTSTQVSMVPAPATNSGTSVSSTSVIRRSVSQSSRLITTSAQMPAWMNALGPVSVLQSRDTGVKGVIHSGIWALVGLNLPLWLTLRGHTDLLPALVLSCAHG